MKIRFRRLSLRSLSIALIAVLMLASVALAQSSDEGPPVALAGAMLMFVLIFGLGCYVYMALAL
jgi:hypothetical protein